MDTDTIWEPRATPDQKAIDAVEAMAFEMVDLEDAIRAGAKLPDQKRINLAALARRIQDAVQS